MPCSVIRAACVDMSPPFAGFYLAGLGLAAKNSDAGLFRRQDGARGQHWDAGEIGGHFASRVHTRHDPYGLQQGRHQPVLNIARPLGYIAPSGSDWRGDRLEHLTLEAGPVASPMNDTTRRGIDHGPSFTRLCSLPAPEMRRSSAAARSRPTSGLS